MCKAVSSSLHLNINGANIEKGVATMIYETLLVEKQERKVTVTLNRPDAVNAMNAQMLEDLANCFEELSRDTTLQMLVLRGAGRVFSAGGDVRAMAAGGNLISPTIMGTIKRLVLAFYHLPMVTVGVVHGAAAGLGFSLALACDIVIAEESSKLAMNFIGIALIPDGGGHFFMKQRVGTVKAKQMIWQGDLLNGEQALSLGLIDYNATDGTLDAVADQVIGKLLGAPLLAMIETKRILHSTHAVELEAVLDAEADGQVRMHATSDHAEGLRAFLGKRTPQFNGQ